MQLKNDAFRYGAVAQLFHWTIVALIITQVVLANKAEALALGPAKIATFATHKSIGMTIFGLAVLRLIWRWFNPVPEIPSKTPQWQRWAAHASHWALYALIMITPVIGWLTSSARNFPVSWFGLVTLPDFVEPDTARYEFFHETHEVLATTLLAVAIVHAVAALKHHFFDRDNVLRRVLPVKLKPEYARTRLPSFHGLLHALETRIDSGAGPSRHAELCRGSVEHAADGKPTDFRRNPGRRAVRR